MTERYDPRRPIVLPADLVREIEEAQRGMSGFDVAVLHESDRGAILVIAEESSRLLRELLVRRFSMMSMDEWERCFSAISKANLRDFGGRIQAATAIGALKDSERQALTALRELRNAVAHRPLEATFHTPVVKEKFDAWLATALVQQAETDMLRNPKVKEAHRRVQAQAPDLLPRHQFVSYSVYLQGVLEALIDKAAPSLGVPEESPE